MATDPHLMTNAGTEPSVYDDPGYGADAALDAFTGMVHEPTPVDPAELLAHDVTLVLVAHNGQRWLPRTLESLAELDRPPERIIAVDTGSTDDSARLLASALGAHSVISAPATTGFGAAVAIGVKESDGMAVVTTGVTHRPDRTEWLWILHDDSAPAPDALRHLLEAAVRRPDAGVIGPKVLSWREDRQLLEVGLTISGGGRRHTGLDKREYDQGQHDEARNVLAVGSAGMLVRRDVWDSLRGFDPVLSIFRDDIDLGWRANQAGHRVVVSPEAAIYHAEAAAHGRRRLHATRLRPHFADRQNALYVLLANSSLRALPLVFLRMLVGGLGRAIGFLVGKQPALALEELLAIIAVAGRPDRLVRARLRRRRTRTRPNSALRSLFPSTVQQMRQAGENLFGMVSGSGAAHDVPGTGRRAISGDEDDEIPDNNDDTFVARLLLHPAFLTVTGLVVVTLAAIRSLIGTGRLTGGALLPAPDAAAELWQTYTESWHGVGLGSPTPAPPYLAVVAVLATLLRSASFAVDVLLLGSVPLAGVTAYLLARRLVQSRWLRVWAAVTYALLPATTGAIAAGRLGTAVAAVVTPLAVLAVMRTLGRPGEPGPFRVSWAAGLLLAVVAAFVPVAWVVALVLGGVAVVAGYRDRFSLARIGAVLLVAPVALVPWTGAVLSDPVLLVTEAGQPGPDLSDTALEPWAVLLQHPGGPGGAPMWLGVGLVLAGWAALLSTGRRRQIAIAWVVVTVALVAGIVVSRLPVSGPTLETPVSGWPGYLTVLLGGALIAAAVLAAEGARGRLSRASFGWRQPLAVVAVGAAAVTPVIGAAWWVLAGADDPLDRRDPRILPAYVADEAERADRVRTLLLDRVEDGRITYALLRSSGPRLGDAETGPPPDQYGPLDDVVADLVSGRGGADGARLAEFAAKYVYLPKPFDPDLADTLDTVPGLVRSSAPEGAAMWRVDQPVARVWLADPAPEGGAEVPEAGSGVETVTVPSGSVAAGGEIPEGLDGRTVVMAEMADPGWTAELDGVPLEATAYDDWAQAFGLGAGAGDLRIDHTGSSRSTWLWIQLGAVVVIVVLSLPGMRRERGAVDDAAEFDPDEITVPEIPVVPATSSSRRERQSRPPVPDRPMEPGPVPRREPLPPPESPPRRETVPLRGTVPRREPWPSPEPPPTGRIGPVGDDAAHVLPGEPGADELGAAEAPGGRPRGGRRASRGGRGSGAETTEGGGSRYRGRRAASGRSTPEAPAAGDAERSEERTTGRAAGRAAERGKDRSKGGGRRAAGRRARGRGNDRDQGGES